MAKSNFESLAGAAVANDNDEELSAIQMRFVKDRRLRSGMPRMDTSQSGIIEVRCSEADWKQYKRMGVDVGAKIEVSFS